MQRLGKNIGGYFGETITLVDILREIESAAVAHGWQSEDFLHLASLRMFALHRAPLSTLNSQPPYRIYISTGMHGDEPAGPVAAMRLLHENRWPPNLELWFCPCLNPSGFVLNRRENADGVDVNRDYRNPRTAEAGAHIAWLERQPAFDVYLCLHEDWESQGFYLYEQNPDKKPSLAEKIIESVQNVCPIDRSEIIEGRPAQNGIVRPDIRPQERPDWPEAFYLITHKSRLGYTLEAPSDFPLQTRVNALVAGVSGALGSFS
jgi:hypothetical protein